MGISIEDLVGNLADSGLLSQDEMATVHDSIAAEPHVKTGDDLARELVKQKYLTKLQAAAVLKGKTSNLVFGDYIVLEKIGSGGMGQVFKAQHKPTGKNVALKVLSADAVKNKRLIERFKKEAKAVARLKHPNVVRAYEAGKFNRIRYLVMELVEGENMLARVKRKGPLPVEECVACVLQAARGLGYAHEKGVTHRDIKPSNLLRDRHTGRVKILDMGLARVEEEEDEDAVRLTMPGQMLGTARFMAPEQIEDARNADVRSDVYSLGCTLYYLLRGKAPYSGETVAHTLMAHVNAPVPDLCKKRTDVPDWLGDIFQRMLAKDPGERYQKMSDLVDEIQLHLGEQMARESSDHVLDDDDTGDEDDYSKLISGRAEEGSSLESLYSEDASAPSGLGRFTSEADDDPIEQLVDDSPNDDADSPAPENTFGYRPADSEATSRSSVAAAISASELPVDTASPQAFRLPEAQEDADDLGVLPAAPGATADQTESPARGGDYVRDKLKQRQDHQREANRRVQMIASAVVGAAVMGLVIWFIAR
jgi:serine/threonine protein kinase